MPFVELPFGEATQSSPLTFPASVENVLDALKER